MQSQVKMNKIGVIGGSRLATLSNLVITHQAQVKTPYGEPSSNLVFGLLQDKEVVFLSRRGEENMGLPPHKINFRANIWALRDAGVDTVIGTSAVAGIHKDYRFGTIILPDQLIDYTFGRDNTFFGDENGVRSIEFSEPYSESLRQHLVQSAKALSINLVSHGVYGVTHGPRLETRAEVKRMDQDGCDFTGMTGMPEAALARELGLEYSCLALVVRWAAGCGDVPDEKAEELLNQSASATESLIEHVILNLDSTD